MNTKNVNFGEDKLRIKIYDKNSISFQGGTVSVLYEDISSLSVIKNQQKSIMLFFGLCGLGAGGYFYMNSGTSSSLFLIGIGFVSLIIGLFLPKELLGVETRGGSQYLVSVPGSEIFELIDEIEKRRKNLKNIS